MRLICIASTKNNNLNGIGRGPSLNNSGLVAFTGTNSDGQGIYVADETTSKGGGLFRNISPGFTDESDHTFGDHVQINDIGYVVAYDRENRDPIRTFVRIWNSQTKDRYTTIGASGDSNDGFAEIMAFPSINNVDADALAGRVVFGAFPNSSPCTPVLVAPARAASRAATFNRVMLVGKMVRPRIADNGRIVVYSGSGETGPIWAYKCNLSGDPDDVAHMVSPAPSFSEIGVNPGISGDGQIVAFYGNLAPHAAEAWQLAPGPGIFASILIPGLGWTVHRVASIGDGGIKKFVRDGNIRVNSVRMFTYLAEDSAGNQGIYMTRLSFFSSAPPKPKFCAVAQPILIAVQRAALDLADGSSLGTVEDIDIADAPNLGGDVVFWVQTNDKNQAIALMPRCGLSGYQDKIHSTYINQHAAGSASRKFPVGLPGNSHSRRGGNACGASSLTMLLNALAYAGEGNADRQDLVRIYRAVAKRQPVIDGGTNWYDLERAIALAKSLGYLDVRYVEGKAAIDAELDRYVSVVTSTRFGRADENGVAKWGRGHIVLLLSRNPADPSLRREACYVVDDPAGYQIPTSTPPLGRYGPGFCGEHVSYPESIVAEALWRHSEKLGLIPRGGVAIAPARGINRNVMLVSAMFIGPDSAPYQLWLEDTAAQRTGWLPDGKAIEDIPNSMAIVTAIVVPDPPSLPWDPSNEDTWPYGMPTGGSEPRIGVFVYGNKDTDYSIETLLFTTAGVIRSVTTGTVAEGETRQVGATAPVLYGLRLSSTTGGDVSVSPTLGPYPDGAEVTVTGTPDAEHVFADYIVDGETGYLDELLTLYMDTNHTVIAEFTSAPHRVHDRE